MKFTDDYQSNVVASLITQVDLYFRGQVVLSNMYRLMEENNRPTAQEAIDAVKNGE